MTEPFKGRIGVIGAGALGALYGARMARAGHDVHFLLRSDYDHVREHGIEIRSEQGDFTLRPPVSRSPEEMGVCDLVLVGLKTTDNGALPPLLRPVVGPETIILTLQNGLGNEDFIAEQLRGWFPRTDPRPRVLGGVAFLCSNRIAPGVIHHISYGHVRLAELAGPATARTESVAQLFRDAAFGAETADSLEDIRWRKLVWNIPFNGLGVAAERCDSKAALEDDAISSVVIGLMEETIAAARADNVAIEREFLDLMIDYTRKMGAYKSSMQLDFEAGRPLEVEAIVGEPLRRARKADIPVPRMEMLHAILRRRDLLNRP